MTAKANELPVGRIAGAFGIRGELKCDPTGAGRIAFSPGAQLRFELDRTSQSVRLTHVRPHAGRLLIRIAGVDDAQGAQTYSGGMLYALRERVALREGEYLDDDLAGCAVRGIDGTAYGTVDRVEHYPASDMLIVDGRMVPMVGAIVTAIDLTRREILIDPPAGLFDG